MGNGRFEPDAKFAGRIAKLFVDHGDIVAADQVVAMMQTEPDKLMFRIRVWIAPERFKGHEAIVRSGLPGIAYVRTEPSVVWAPSLQPSPPPRARRRCGVTLALSAGRAVGLIGPASHDSIRKLWGGAGPPPAANRRRTGHGDNRTCTRRVYATSPRAERGCRSARLHSGRRPYLMARREQLERQIEEMKAHHSRRRAVPADQQWPVLTHSRPARKRRKLIQIIVSRYSPHHSFAS
jgi:hypothetical protein